MTEKKKITYCQAIFEAYDYLLDNYPNFFVIGQGLWSPWYVGNTMNGLEKKYGKNRVIDSPVAEMRQRGLRWVQHLQAKGLWWYTREWIS